MAPVTDGGPGVRRRCCRGCPLSAWSVTDIELLNQILCCPACRRPLELQTLEGCSIGCHCGASYPLESGLIDFHAEEQQLTNNWSGSFTESPEDEQARRDRWLATGLLTTEDLEQMGQPVNAEPVRAALAEAGFVRPEGRQLYAGVSHLRGDMFPLKGDNTHVVLVSADRS